MTQDTLGLLAQVLGDLEDMGQASGPFAPGIRAITRAELRPLENTHRRLGETLKALDQIVAAEALGDPTIMHTVPGRLQGGDLARRRLPKYGVPKETVDRISREWGAKERVEVLDAHMVYLGPRKAEWIGSIFLDGCEVVVRSETWGRERTSPPLCWGVY